MRYNNKTQNERMGNEFVKKTGELLDIEPGDVDELHPRMWPMQPKEKWISNKKYSPTRGVAQLSWREQPRDTQKELYDEEMPEFNRLKRKKHKEVSPKPFNSYSKPDKMYEGIMKSTSIRTHMGKLGQMRSLSPMCQ